MIRFEWIRAWRDQVLRVTLVLFALAAAYSTFTGARWAERQEVAVRLALAEADETMALRRAKYVEIIAKGEKPDFGLIYATALPFRAGLPTAPLALLSAGQAEGYPAAASISPFIDPYSIFDAHMSGLESPSVLAAGRFDLAFVVVVLLPLMLIAATYDFWSRDVENGSARFQLAQPVRPAQLILSRAAVRGGSVLLASTLIAATLLGVAGASAPAGLGLFMLVMLAYGLFWIALTVLINLFVRASTAAALASGTAWLVIVILLPAGVAAAVDIAVPRPSALAHTNAVRAAGLEVRAANLDAARAAAEQESDRAYPATLWHSRGEIQQRDALLERLHRAHAEQWHRHRSLAEQLRFLSPAVAAQDALDRVAGTHAARALSFQDQARGFAARVRRLAFDWMDQERLLTLADYDGGLPRFAFVEPPRGDAIAADLIAVLLFTASLFTFIALRLRAGATKLL
jgi:ABC-2 type transport system permease protein